MREVGRIYSELICIDMGYSASMARSSKINRIRRQWQRIREVSLNPRENSQSMSTFGHLIYKLRLNLEGLDIENSSHLY